MVFSKIFKRSSSKNELKKKEKRSVSFNTTTINDSNQDGGSQLTTQSSSRYVLTRKNTSLFDLHASDGSDTETFKNNSSSPSSNNLNNNNNNDINYLNTTGICFINKLPYDVLAIILEKVHSNKILTKQFCNISLVCIHWRKLTRINGQLIPLDSFFKKIQNIKMKPDVIEHCMNYFNYIYPSLEEIEIGQHSINNRIFSKNAIYLIQNIDKVTNVQIDMLKVNPTELELLFSELKTKKTIKKLVVNNCTGAHLSILIDLIQTLHCVNVLTMNHVAFDTPQDHQDFIALFQVNRTITELSFSFVPNSPLINSHYVKTIKSVLAINQTLTAITFEKSTQPQPIVNNKKQQQQLLAAQQAQQQSFENISSSLSEEDLTKYTTLYNNKTNIINPLTNITLRNVDLSDSDLIDLSPFFTAESIKSIDLSYNKSLTSIEPLIKSLINSSSKNSLSHLNLSGLPINDCTLIGQYMGSNKNLSSLILNDCGGNGNLSISSLSNVSLVSSSQPGLSCC